MVRILNINGLRGPALEQALAKVLRDLFGSIRWLKTEVVEERAEPWDLRATVRTPAGGGSVEFLVECKTVISPSQLDTLIASRGKADPGQQGQQATPVVAAPRISDRVAARCADAGWGWFDLAGNARLEQPGLFYLERTGKEPVALKPSRRTNLGSPEAARVLRAILVPENAGLRWTHRKIRDHIGELEQLEQPLESPSLGLINKVVRHLRDEACVQEHPDGGFLLADPMGLLGLFSAAYRFDRIRQVELFTLMPPRQLRDTLAVLDVRAGGAAAYAAFSAADRQAPMVRQPKTWVMVAARSEHLLMELTEAKGVDSGANLVALIPEDDGPFYRAHEADGSELRCTNPLQTYLDLVHVGGRGEEAAEAVLDKCLKPAWIAGGLMKR